MFRTIGFLKTLNEFNSSISFLEFAAAFKGPVGWDELGAILPKPLVPRY